MIRDLTCAIVLLGIAVAYYVLASGIGRSALSDEVGPAGLPIAYAVLLAVLAVALALKTALQFALRKAPQARTSGPSRSAGYVLARAAGTLAIGAVYVACLNVLGYWLSLALLLTATALYQGATFTRNTLLITVGGATAFWLIFVWLLGIPMPGPWLGSAA